MYSGGVVFALCAVSMLVGMVLTLAAVLCWMRTREDYHDPDDWLNAEWVRDYEEIKNGR